MNKTSELLGYCDGGAYFFPKGTELELCLSDYPKLEAELIEVCEKFFSNEIKKEVLNGNRS